MRINGLVSVFNQVRAQLRDGIPPSGAEAFRKRITATVAQVEAICREHGTTPDGLPAPSRAAYRFLKGLDLANLPLAPDGGPANVVSTFRLKNILAIERHLAIKMWTQLDTLLDSAPAASRLKRDIERHASMIDAMRSRYGVTPWTLQLPSRRVYCWLKFLADEDNLDLHLRALLRARSALADVRSPTSSRR